MDGQLGRALWIASEDLGDPARCERAWSSLLRLAVEAGAWRYLRREAEGAALYARNSGSPDLAALAASCEAQARGALG